VQAATNEKEVAPTVLAIVRRLGFDDFTYATARYHLRPNNDERVYYFTTLSTTWMSRYAERAYIERDPQVIHSFGTALPLIWDQESERGKNRKIDAFLEDALAHGVGSGVAFPVCAGSPARTLVAFNFSAPVIDPRRRRGIVANLGNLILFGQCFHELFAESIEGRAADSRSRTRPLSPRERECLQIAAHGMTGREIGFKLGIAERTVTYHFSNIIEKLGVLNRHEAIAKGISQGMIRLTI
jgi:DNA-binding CsgD family transcriptional regulator